MKNTQYIRQVRHAHCKQARFKKGIAPIIIALIIAVVLGGGYAVVKTNPGLAQRLGIEKQEEKKTIDETANWKTYTNEKYGFEFKYPADLKVTLAPHVPPWGTDLVLPSDSKNPRGGDNRSLVDGSVGNILRFSIFKESLRDLEGFVSSGPALYDTFVKETIAGVTAFSIHYGSDPDKKPTTRVFLQSASHVFMFDFSDENSSKGKAILSTLTFIK